jgi:hypothetical protein
MPANRYSFGDFIRAFCIGDEEAMAHNLVKFGGQKIAPANIAAAEKRVRE